VQKHADAADAAFLVKGVWGHHQAGHRLAGPLLEVYIDAAVLFASALCKGIEYLMFPCNAVSLFNGRLQTPCQQHGHTASLPIPSMHDYLNDGRALWPIQYPQRNKSWTCTIHRPNTIPRSNLDVRMPQWMAFVHNRRQFQSHSRQVSTAHCIQLSCSAVVSCSDVDSRHIRAPEPQHTAAEAATR